MIVAIIVSSIVSMWIVWTEEERERERELSHEWKYKVIIVVRDLWGPLKGGIH